ncbi:MAG TPA: TetR/AcrR family transcriptional regulator [Holophaga sp.]|nr:TetR/AcrR family transcriptional regulator [Holophaga sp.]
MKESPPSSRPRGPKSQRMEPGQLLDAAQKVFARDGLSGATLRAIAREAGCDPALIYYHFENKEAIFAALIERMLPVIRKGIQAIAHAKGERHAALQIWDVLEVYRAHLTHDAGFRSMIRGQIVLGAEGIRDQLTQHIRPLFMEVVEVIQQGIRCGEIRSDIHPLICVFFLVRMQLEILDLIPAMSQRIIGQPAEIALPLVQRQWFEVFWRGIARHPEQPIPFPSEHP